MTEAMKKLMEVISGSEENTAKLREINEKFPDKKDNMIELIKLADTLGITLTEADFDESNQMTELDDDELDGITGGTMIEYGQGMYASDCKCAVAGGGSGDALQKTCACVLGGCGELTELGKQYQKKGRIVLQGSKGAPVAIYCAGMGAAWSPNIMS